MDMRTIVRQVSTAAYGLALIAVCVLAVVIVYHDSRPQPKPAVQLAPSAKPEPWPYHAECLRNYSNLQMAVFNKLSSADQLTLSTQTCATQGKVLTFLAQ